MCVYIYIYILYIYIYIRVYIGIPLFTETELASPLSLSLSLKRCVECLSRRWNERVAERSRGLSIAKTRASAPAPPGQNDAFSKNTISRWFIGICRAPC